MTEASYAELFCFSNFTFLTGASHPHELAERAAELGYHALAITDACSVAGIPRAWAALKDSGVNLITGSWFELENAPEGAALPRFILLARTRKGYGQLCQLITTGRRQAEKGRYRLYIQDIEIHELDDCLCLWLPPCPAEADSNQAQACGEWLHRLFEYRFWIAASRTLASGEEQHLNRLRWLSDQLKCPVTAMGEVHMHSRERQPLQDVLTALRHHTNLENAGHCLFQNGERYLRPLPVIQRLFPDSWLRESIRIANQCSFRPDELRYEYPADLVPENETPAAYLKRLVHEGEQRRFPEGTPLQVQSLIRKELELIAEKNYEHYFLTIYDIVAFARSQNILCQGRGSAANSAVCYCLGITEVDPTKVKVLFERFISKERDEPPDIDVDFEHERREEVIQYIYRRYSRERAALAATVIRYRPRSAVRDVGKALGFDPSLVERLLEGIDWRDKASNWRQQILDKNLTRNPKVADQFFTLVNTLLGFPRHLSQHVGGFVISAGPLAELVPVENAAMADRTVIQWDKDDLESLGLMKVDVLALGMLSAIRKALELISQKLGGPFGLPDIEREDPRVYDMLCEGDSIGVFQVESRAQMNMLPRLRPRKYYDLVIQVAIVRPGPIQGDMVHPFLKRRDGIEAVDYPSDDVASVLDRTLGVPIFQEQVIKLAMVAAGFSAGEADRLRRAMAAWKSHGDLTPFRDKLIRGMLERGYSDDFAERLYHQICGFGGYGFPESHAASFALLVYVSSWIKRHHPEAFYCALLNSQPMGFYSPSQLVQDAKRHGVTVLPPDVNHSQWDHTLAGEQQHLRLGLRIIQGLSRYSAERIQQNRPETGYHSTAELRQRAALNQRDMETLAGANAMPGFTSNRHQAYWQLLDHEHPTELFAGEAPASYQPDHCAQLPEPSEGQNILADYNTQGLTLQRHPLALLREQGHLHHCMTSDQLKTTKAGIPVQVAGLVTGRQRPGSAAGVTFVTLEDETGNVNVVVWLETARRQRKPLLTARLLHVKGVLERKGDIVHVMAGKLSDLSHLINSLPVSSRDFH
ncbi:error-prone DNA polymerase [Marinobacter salinexigens]|uniref:Error-prone DNA polymerase n=1 Tax=Marinobacter salinexigens TaxID=2919747 RepID=A0A5B0VHC6_9GAMM|nr:error-prone DNA polymerase [Marinobacter salinexigens]KAA1173768.1 error-prone DNA polymerase [Marinobacter salinexigens]